MVTVVFSLDCFVLGFSGGLLCELIPEWRLRRPGGGAMEGKMGGAGFWKITGWICKTCGVKSKFFFFRKILSICIDVWYAKLFISWCSLLQELKAPLKWILKGSVALDQWRCLNCHLLIRYTMYAWKPVELTNFCFHPCFEGLEVNRLNRLHQNPLQDSFIQIVKQYGAFSTSNFRMLFWGFSSKGFFQQKTHQPWGFPSLRGWVPWDDVRF